MADIVVSEKKKINIFDRVIQAVVIMVNMSKMNRAIDEHLNNINKLEKEEQKEYQQNILREIIFVKYQYDIMQREMYELKISYSEDIISGINSTDKTERLKLQKIFLEMEYDRVTKSKFKFKEDVKYHLLILSSVIEEVKQNIKDEGKNKRYNNLVKAASEIDTKIQTDEYIENMYKEMFEVIDDYVGYINDNYDIARLPSDERELIEFVIETMIKGIGSDLDRHMYEFKILINICKNSYRYFKIVDKVFFKLIKIYNESLASDVVTLKDYIRMYKEIYDMKIKTMVNDVHRTIKTEDEYLEYSKLVTNFMYDELDTFILDRAYETAEDEVAKKIIGNALGKVEIIEKNEEITIDNNENLIKKVSLKDKIVKKIKNVTSSVKSKKTKKDDKVKEKKPKKEKKVIKAKNKG
ncbi:MAG: hypothetical protein PHD15_03060 [Clostridia bacterium]|nr:hypothetical protein [Clostridia bacterium]MDD4386725.1 hypothetical protein [Clostridia bacterium]